MGEAVEGEERSETAPPLTLTRFRLPGWVEEAKGRTPPAGVAANAAAPDRSISKESGRRSICVRKLVLELGTGRCVRKMGVGRR